MKRAKYLFPVLAAVSLLTGMQVSAEGYGQGRERDAMNRPAGAVTFQAQYAASGAFALSDDPQRIILTFDQGYENGYTAKILDTLKEKHVTAIFFLTGDYARKEPALIKRMIAEGHTLGNHGMTHACIAGMNSAAIEEELMTLHSFVQQQYGYDMQYFRPPCGEYDPRALEAVSALGYKTVFWSCAHVDWITDDQPDPAEALQTLTDAAHGGAIYLLHAVSATNAAILGDLIDALRAKGYTL